MSDEQRRAMVPQMPAELRAAMERGEQVWTTGELKEDFEVLSFAAPFVVVRRRADGRPGTMMFTHAPRFYFGWEED